MHKPSQEKLADMDIHQQIKTARERKGWSMERLASEVSKAEELKKPLSWQTVQQWENGASAPKRTRMEVVRRLLALDDLAGPPEPGSDFGALTDDEQRFVDNLREIQVDEDEWRRILEEVAIKAAKIRALREKLLAPHGIRSTPARHFADAKKTELARAALEVTEQLRQRSLLDDIPPEKR